ncbi:unnamed protein product, partial [Mesorhabditis spiculigera]
MAVVYSDVEEYDPLARDDYGTADCSELTTHTVSNAFFDGPVDEAGEPVDGKEDKAEEEEQLKTVDQKEDRVKADEDLGDVKEAEEGVKEQEHVEPKVGDGEEEEEEEEEEIPPTVKEVTFINDVPIYKPNHLLMDEKNHYKCVVYERVGFDDKVGGTYLVTAHDKEMVLRVEKIPGRIIGQELEFLKKVEADNKWPYFSQLHSGWNADGYAFYMLYYRPGPSFRQIRDFMNYRPLSHGSAARLMRDVFMCIRYVHKYSMLLRCLEPEMFHFDAAGRNLFLSDLSTIRADPGKRDWSIPVSWAGGPHYAPTNTGSVRARDEIEAWLYFLIEMLVGQLPWTGKPYDKIHQIKMEAVQDAGLVKGLPFVYTELYHHVMALPNTSHIPEKCYNEIEEFCVRIYEQVGGVTSHEDNFDFERDPLETELPKFVMERSDKIPETIPEE